MKITEIQSFAGLDQLKKLKKNSKKKELISKNYFNLISKHKKYFFCYFPNKKIKSAWYRFYFFIKPNINNYKKIRFKIIGNLKKNNLKCFTGSCPEIYLEKSFKNLKNFKITRLKNCRQLGETSIALEINHTLSYSQYRKNFLIFKNEIEKIF